MRCACQRLKKEWHCCNVQATKQKGTHKGAPGVGLLSCDAECARLATERKEKEETEELRHRKLKETEVCRKGGYLELNASCLQTIIV